nr:MAG TPA: hypothetical protein [Herelleviridae sp.]
MKGDLEKWALRLCAGMCYNTKVGMELYFLQ